MAQLDEVLRYEPECHRFYLFIYLFTKSVFVTLVNKGEVKNNHDPTDPHKDII